jgi:hypothetical protein
MHETSQDDQSKLRKTLVNELKKLKASLEELENQLNLLNGYLLSLQSSWTSYVVAELSEANDVLVKK